VVSPSRPEDEPCREVDLPVTVVTNPLTIAPHLHLGKAGVRLDDGPRSYFFGGSGIAASAETARTVAVAEVYERVLAHPALHRERAAPFALRGVLSGGVVGSAHPNEVLFQGKHAVDATPDELRRDERRAPRTNGLAYYPELGGAVRHGMLEVLERHLACRAWYEPGTALVRIGEATPLPDGYVLERYTIERAPALPFAVSVVGHAARPAFFCGTALRERLDEAVEKADREALGALDGWFAGPQAATPNPVTSARFARLVGDSAAVLRELWNAKVRPGADPLDAREVSASLAELCAELCPSPDAARYAILWRTPHGWAVRAMASGLLEKRAMREAAERSGFPSDPFV
jgi:hypothetical protein